MEHSDACFVCNKQIDGDKQQLACLKSQHSNIPITVLIKSILREYHTIRDVDNVANVICPDCFERLEHCEWQRITAKRCERELFDLLVCTESLHKSKHMTILHTLDLVDSDDSSSSLIAADAIKAEPTDTFDEDDSNEVAHQQDASNEYNTSTSDAEESAATFCKVEHTVKRGRPRIHPIKPKGRKPGRPRIHPPKPKGELKKRGRPRIHPEKPPGEPRKRGRPPKNPLKFDNINNADGIARNRDRPIGLPLKALIKAEYNKYHNGNIMIKLPLPNPLHMRQKAKKQHKVDEQQSGITTTAEEAAIGLSPKIKKNISPPGVAKKRGRPPKISSIANDPLVIPPSSESMNVSTANDSLNDSNWTDILHQTVDTSIVGTATPNEIHSAVHTFNSIMAGLKKRGRPRKHPIKIRSEPAKRGRPRIHPVTAPGIRKRRGRPPKHLQNYVIPRQTGRQSMEQSNEPFSADESMILPLEVQIKSEPESADEGDSDSYTQQFCGFPASDELEYI